MCSIKLVWITYIQKSFHWLCTPASIKCKNTASSSKTLFVRIQTTKCSYITCVFTYITAHRMKTQPHLIQLLLHSHKIIHTKIHPQALIQKILPYNPAKCPSLLTFYIRLSLARTNICQNIHKNSSQFL